NAVELNPALYIPGNCAAGQYGLVSAGPCSSLSNINIRRILNLANPAAAAPLGYVTQFDDGGTQGYHGLLVSTNWRLRKGISLNANYTWSHCIGLAVNTLLNPGGNYLHQAGQNVGPVNRNLDVGDCATDRRHIANITMVAQTPTFSNKVMRLIGSGWTASTIYTVRSGSPLTVTLGS